MLKKQAEASNEKKAEASAEKLAEDSAEKTSGWPSPTTTSSFSNWELDWAKCASGPVSAENTSRSPY